MSGLRRVVFDSSTLVSAALRPNSAPYAALQLALGVCEICASKTTLAELARVLERRKFDRYLGVELRRSFVAMLSCHVAIHAVEKQYIVAARAACRDSGDAPFLALTLAAQADVVVSSDEDLLILDPWKNIPILPPSDFLKWIERGKDAREPV